MNAIVSVWSMVCMAISALISFAIPVVLCIWFRKKKHADLLPFFIGMAVILLFALILESLVHQLVLNVLPIGKMIVGNIWLYALYGGLMAGLFEETGRFVVFKTILKKYRDRDMDALMYGAGHGGFEAAFLLGGSMISNIVMAIMLNLGLSSVITSGVTAEQMPQVQAVFDSLINSAPYTFLLGIIERLIAVVLQIALSVIVWFGANRKGKWLLYPLAILLHAAVDGIAVILAQYTSLWITEGALFALMLLVALLARLIWNKYHKEEREDHESNTEEA